MIKRLTKLLLALCLLCSVFSMNAQHASRKEFNQDWKFILDSTYHDTAVVVNDYSSVTLNDKSWRTLNLPHDWSIEGDFSKDHPATPGGGALPGGYGLVPQDLHLAAF